MVDAPPAKRQKRSRRRRRQPSLDLDTSSSSEEEAEIVASTSAPPPVASSSSSDSSSSSSSESEPEPTPKRKGKQKAVVPDAIPTTNGHTEALPAVPKYERSPSPPYFGFSKRKPGQRFLEGQVPGDEVKPVEEGEEEASFREFYQAKLVERFGGELAGLEKEVQTEDRLQMLIKSLAGGADLFLSTRQPLQRDVVLQATEAQPKEQIEGDMSE